MAATILDGNAIARQLRNAIADKVRDRLAHGHNRPGLAVLLVGDDPGSKIYVRLKRKDCHEVGFNVEVWHLPSQTRQADLVAKIDELNADPVFNGILVQLPLPDHIDPVAVTERVLPNKDVDGVHPSNMGRLVLREPAIRPCTSKAVMSLLAHTGVVLRGLHATVVGASNHVGRPMGLELLLAGCTVTTVHRFSRDTRVHVAQADIVVSATGKAGLIASDWVKPGAIVIDVGIVAQADGKVRGDVCFEEVAPHAGWITPVPGGVGPMTRASLLENTLYAAEIADRQRTPRP
ncbi:MAG: bifunctional methylenetetrahydrofolate dehydrogenase/methenyltetrahydrofolate cyclohydrolase FolD [Gammaproteobacteria bacterium]|nr:bifunctional methylenetetrahydrofolate dehydrogenase/methenyltetrahydrofolate cyclohydrolase FolD [Gammaproteobacteria bacterium]